MNMHRKCTPQPSCKHSPTVSAHKTEIRSSSQIWLNLQITHVQNVLLVLILALRARIVDEPSFLFTKRRQPERTTHNTWHQLGEGLAIGELLRIRQNSSSSSRATIIGSQPSELGIELSLNFLELVVGSAI